MIEKFTLVRIRGGIVLMKVFRELYFRGSENDLKNFLNDIEKYITDDWSLSKHSDYDDYIYFEYLGNELEKSRLFIHTGKDIYNGELKVNNIVPLEKNQLSIEEYNNILMKFYNDIISRYKLNSYNVDISEPSDDNFDPTKVITEEALNKLKLFCSLANKSTGSSHQNDQVRWFDFIAQTVDDNKLIDYNTLADFLKDETYWGKRPKNYIGTIGDYAWNEDTAYKLASEYEILSEFLLYYKKTRNV